MWLCHYSYLVCNISAANTAHPDSTLYVFTDSTPKDPYKQEKIDSLIASKRLRIFFIVMGTCSPTDQNGLKFSANLNHAIGMSDNKN